MSLQPRSGIQRHPVWIISHNRSELGQFHKVTKLAREVELKNEAKRSICYGIGEQVPMLLLSVDFYICNKHCIHNFLIRFFS